MVARLKLREIDGRAPPTSIFIIAFGLGIVLAGGAKMAQGILMVPICVLQHVSSLVLAYRISASDSVEVETYHFYYYPSTLTVLLSLVLIVR